MSGEQSLQGEKAITINSFQATLSAINSKIECNKNCAEPTATFSLTYEVRGSLRKDRESDSIPNLGRITFKTFKYLAIGV